MPHRGWNQLEVPSRWIQVSWPTSKIRAMAVGKGAQDVKRSCPSWPVEAASATEGKWRGQWTWPIEPRRGHESRTCTSVTARDSTGRFRRVRFCRCPGFAECFEICPARSRTTCRCSSEGVRSFHQEVPKPVGQTLRKRVPENRRCMMPPQQFRQNFENCRPQFSLEFSRSNHRLFTQCQKWRQKSSCCANRWPSWKGPARHRRAEQLREITCSRMFP